MKKSILSLALILFATVLVAQPAGKWSTGGNAISSGDFIGTTNNFPFDFRVNNVQQMSIGTNGVLTINSLIGTGNRILLSDANGNISALPQGGPDEFLLSNGTWGSLPVSATVWKSFGNDISYLGGNLGIGTSSPSYKLDVLGDARVSNNLYVGGGIIVTDKLDATVEVKAGDVIVNNELQVNGNSKIAGQVTAIQGLAFDNTGTIGVNYSQGSGPGSGNIQYGLKLPGYTPPPCAAAPTSLFTHQFGGLLQVYDPVNASNSSLLNLQSWATAGSTPAGSSIDASLAGTGPSGLLINYFCKSNTFINTAGGEVHTGDKVYMNNTLKIGSSGNANFDLNTSIEIYNASRDGIKFISPYNNTKLISVDNSNLPGASAFLVKGDGSTEVNTFNNGSAFKVNGYNGSAYSNNFLIYGNGRTEIHIQNPIATDKALYVVDDFNNKDIFLVKSNGKTYAREVEITLIPQFPDYVFENSYNLMSLSALDKYIKNNKHLPGFKKGEYYEKNGINVNELLIKQQEKIEELTLYIIQMEKRISNIESKK